MEHIKGLFNQSLVYGLPGILSQVVAIFLVPIYTGFLSPEKVGVLALIATATAIFYTFLSLGMGSAVFRSYFFEKQENRPTVISTAFIFMSIFPLAVLTLLLLSSQFLSALFFKTGDYRSILQIAFIGLYFNTGLLIPYAFFRAREKPSVYILVTVAQLLGNVFFSILFVVFLRLGITGAVLGTTIGNTLAYVTALILILPHIVLKFSKRIIREMLSFGLPLVPAGFAMWGLNASDRFFLAHFQSLPEVGFYNVGYRIGQILSLAVGAFQLAWVPFMFKVAKEKGAKNIYSNVTLYYFVVLLFLVLALSSFARSALIVLTPSFYWDAFTLVAPIAFSYLLYGLYYLFAVGINLEKKTLYMVFVVLAGAVVNVIFNLALIPNFGVIGAAFATLISFLTLAVLSYFFSKRFYQIDYPWFKIFLALVLFIVILLPTLFIQRDLQLNFWASAGTGLLATGLFAGAVLVTKIINREKMFELVNSNSIFRKLTTSRITQN